MGPLYLCTTRVDIESINLFLAGVRVGDKMFQCSFTWMNEMLRYEPIITSETQIYQEPQKSKTASFIQVHLPALIIFWKLLLLLMRFWGSLSVLYIMPMVNLKFCISGYCTNI